jgi:hypothetical protein
MVSNHMNLNYSESSSTSQISYKMFNKIVVREALKHSWALEKSLGLEPINIENAMDSVNSLLIYDIFGGEILKTPRKNGWHFYNRIDGERIDFLIEETEGIPDVFILEDIPSTPEETHNYFEEEDYSSFLMCFIRTFEEAIGLDKYNKGYFA